MALKIAAGQINDGIFKRILVLGADKAYSDNERFFFGTAMGDAVIGMMLTDGPGVFEMLGGYVDTFLYATDGEKSLADDIQKYRDTLPSLMLAAYRKCLQECFLEKVDYIAPHTSSKGIWDLFSKVAGIDRKRILDEDITFTGHLNSNDSFLHYFTHIERELIEIGTDTMMINPGFGGTRGMTVFRRCC